MLVNYISTVKFQNGTNGRREKKDGLEEELSRPSALNYSDLTPNQLKHGGFQPCYYTVLNEEALVSSFTSHCCIFGAII